MKDLLKVIAILGIFASLGSATFVKEAELPCEFKIYQVLHQFTSTQDIYQGSFNDTVVITATTDTLWDTKTAQICQVLQDSCKLNGRKILVAKWVADSSQRNTRFGKTLFFRTCP